MENTYKKYFEQESLWNNSPVEYQYQVLHDISALLPADVHSVLDVGCGNGIIADNLPQEMEVIGIDISLNALKRLRADPVLGTLERLPFRDKTFDCVMANDIIEHLPDEIYPRCLEELARVSKKNLIITLPFMENFPSNSVLCKKCGTIYHANLHKRSYSCTGIVRLFPPEVCSLQLLCFSGEKRDGSINPFDVFRPLSDRESSGIAPVCPSCGDPFIPEKQDGKRSFFTEMIDSLNEKFWIIHRDLWEYRPDRSECITLWTKSGIPDNYRFDFIHPEKSGFIDNSVIDFSNPAFYYSHPFPKHSVFPAFFVDSATPDYDKNGLKMKIEVSGRGTVYLTFPLNANDGGVLEVIAESCGGPDPEVFIYSLYETYSKLEPACPGVQDNCYHYHVPCGNYITGTGCIFMIEIKNNNVTLCSARFINKQKSLIPEYSASIKQGHNFVKVDEIDYKIPVIFGFSSEYDGRIPIPPWVTHLNTLDRVIGEINTLRYDPQLMRSVIRESENIAEIKEMKINYLNELLTLSEKQKTNSENSVASPDEKIGPLLYKLEKSQTINRDFHVDLENKNILIDELTGKLDETVHRLRSEELKTELHIIKEKYLLKQLKKKKGGNFYHIRSL